MEQLLNLPTPVKAVIAVLTGTTIVGAVAMIDAKLAGIVALGLVLLVVAIAAFLFIRALLRRRKAMSMASELSQHSSSAPAGVNDAAKRARLDDMRRTFGEGLTKFGGAENIYKFPWYLIVGEPGSGKTEAIRHSNVGMLIIAQRRTNRIRPRREINNRGRLVHHASQRSIDPQMPVLTVRVHIIIIRLNLNRDRAPPGEASPRAGLPPYRGVLGFLGTWGFHTT